MNSVTEHKITVFSIQSLYNPSSSIVSSYKPVHLQLCVNQSLRKNINPRTMVSGSFLINLSVNHGFQDHFLSICPKTMVSGWFFINLSENHGFQDDFSSICPRTRVSGSFLIIVENYNLSIIFHQSGFRIIFDQSVWEPWFQNNFWPTCPYHTVPLSWVLFCLVILFL